MARKALGRGIRALIPEDAVPDYQGSSWMVRRIPVAAIRTASRQPRQEVAAEGLEDLSRSIRVHGVLQPVLVRPSDGGFELIAGERRLRAARAAGLEDIPALVREVGDRESLEMALVENLQRENISPIEEALAYRALVDDFGLKQEEIAERVGKERSTVTNILRLLALPAMVQLAVNSRQISMGHARALLGLSKPKEQEALCRRVLKQGLSVRQTEAAVRAKSAPGAKKRKSGEKQLDADMQAFQEALQRHLGTKVRIHMKDDERGSLEIEFYSIDDLNRIAQIIAAQVEG